MFQCYLLNFFCEKSTTHFFSALFFFVYPLPPLASSKMKIDFWNKSCGHSLHFFADPGASYYNYLLLQLLFLREKKLSIKIIMDFSPYYTLKKGVVPFGSEKCNMMPSPTPISRHMFWKINEYTDIPIHFDFIYFKNYRVFYRESSDFFRQSWQFLKQKWNLSRYY